MPANWISSGGEQAADADRADQDSLEHAEHAPEDLVGHRSAA